MTVPEKNSAIRTSGPDWIKLDNAATIYPPTVTRTLAAMFRFSITLDDRIDPVLLEEALKKTIKRIPTFGYKLKTGVFWCYFSRLEGVPSLEKDVNNPMLKIDPKKSGGFLFRVRYYENRIALEVFHALTDGTGGLTFLLTLTSEYLRLKEKCEVGRSKWILDVSAPPEKEELEDAFYRYCRKVGSLEHETPAYQAPGEIEEKHILNIITGKIPVGPLKEKAAEYGCTVTAFLTSVLIDAIQTVKESDEKERKKKGEIKVSVPVNLRQFYPAKTLRNFSSYVNVGIDPKLGHYSFEEIVKNVNCQMTLLINEKRLNSKFSGNVKMQKNVFIRAIPMFIKKRILSLSDLLMGDRYISATFSNIGYIPLPEGIKEHVREMNFVLGRSRNKPYSAACVGCGDRLYISFSSRIKQTDTEKNFFRKLVEMDVPVEIESNRR